MPRAHVWPRRNARREIPERDLSPPGRVSLSRMIVSGLREEDERWVFDTHSLVTLIGVMGAVVLAVIWSDSDMLTEAGYQTISFIRYLDVGWERKRKRKIPFLYDNQSH